MNFGKPPVSTWKCLYVSSFYKLSVTHVHTWVDSRLFRGETEEQIRKYLWFVYGKSGRYITVQNHEKERLKGQILPGVYISTSRQISRIRVLPTLHGIPFIDTQSIRSKYVLNITENDTQVTVT